MKTNFRQKKVQIMNLDSTQDQILDCLNDSTGQAINDLLSTLNNNDRDTTLNSHSGTNIDQLFSNKNSTYPQDLRADLPQLLAVDDSDKIIISGKILKQLIWKHEDQLKN